MRPDNVSEYLWHGIFFFLHGPIICVMSLNLAIKTVLGFLSCGTVYGAGQPVDMMDNAIALPTSPQVQQLQHDVINRILAARSDTGIHLNFAANMSNEVGPRHSGGRSA